MRVPPLWPALITVKCRIRNTDYQVLITCLGLLIDLWPCAHFGCAFVPLRSWHLSNFSLWLMPLLWVPVQHCWSICCSLVSFPGCRLFFAVWVSERLHTSLLWFWCSSYVHRGAFNAQFSFILLPFLLVLSHTHLYLTDASLTVSLANLYRYSVFLSRATTCRGR